MAGVLWHTVPDKKEDSSKPVKVALGDRSYLIEFQALKSLGEVLKTTFNSKAGRCVLISNTIVGPLYSTAACASLKEAGWQVDYLEIPDGETNKTTSTYLTLVEQLLNLKVTRKTVVIGMGGGVTTDIVGFAAATALRGLPFVTVPTSLLAMVDASVGGKTGVNTSHGKNLLGCFWQPSLVLVPVETLATLPDDELRCGMGEVIKHAVLETTANGRPSSVFFHWLENGNGAKVMERDTVSLSHAIRRCCEIKAAVVTADERESGARALLNLGHTIGHAIEQVMGFGAIRHGEAVGLGTVAEARLAVSRGSAESKLPERISGLLQAVGLPVGLPGLDEDALMAALTMDKKSESSDTITVTVPYDIGDVRLETMTYEDLRAGFHALAVEKNQASSFSQPPPVPPVSVETGVLGTGVGAETVQSPTQSSSAFASGSNMNAGNVMTGRSSTRVKQPPGGQSSIIFG